MIDNKLETRKQLADRLSITPLTVDNWRRRGLLQPIKIGGVVRYDSQDTDKMIAAHKQKPTANA